MKKILQIIWKKSFMPSSEIFIPPTFVQIYEDGTKDYAMKIIPKERYEGSKGKKLFEKLNNEIIIQRIINH